MMEWHEELDLILLALDDAPVECDGMTYAISLVLDKAKINHTCMMGHVVRKETQEMVTPHLWIELGDGWVVDLRLRMWLGDEDEVPHGVFRREDHPEFEWTGSKQRRNKTISEIEIDEITGGRFSHVKVPSCMASENSSLGTWKEG